MRLRPLSFREVSRKLSKAGFNVVSQKGSHLKFVKETDRHRLIVIVPHHVTIKMGTLKSIIEQSGMSLVEFENL